MLCCFRDCAHHPAGFVKFTKFAPCWIISMIIVAFPILPIVGTCKIPQTISDGIQHLLKCCFRLCGCQSRLFSISDIILLLIYCCRCVFNSLSCHRGLCFDIILNPFLLLFVAWVVGFSLLPRCKFLFGSPATHPSKGSHPFCLHAALAILRLMKVSSGALCQFAECAWP